MNGRQAWCWCCAVALVGALLGCQAPPESASVDPGELRWTDSWQPLGLPGKRPTRYLAKAHEGKWVLHAQADRSASVHRLNVQVAPEPTAVLEFSWLVRQLIDTADVRQAQVEDAPARVLLAFDGEHQRLSQRNRLMYELMDGLTGEKPPFATLMYVWDRRAPVDALVVNERSDRVRQIVVESGAAHLGQWRHYRREIWADYLRAFGEPPGRLLGIAVMTDSDNTQSQAEAWYGEIRLFDGSRALLRPSP